MPLAALAFLGTVVALSPVDDYSRTFGAASLTTADLEAGRYGEENAFAIEPGGLRLRLDPGDGEAGWKIPQALRVGGDFSIVAEFQLATFPKPAQEDGVAVGLAIATQNIDQPDAVLIRVIEPDGSDVYRSINQPKNAPQQSQMQMQMQMQMVQAMNRPGGPAAKPPRPTFPADGLTFRLEMIREGDSVRYEVMDASDDEARYVGRVPIGSGDLAGVKLFALNRNGAEAVEVLVTSLTIQADRLSGLGTAVRTVFGEIMHGDPIGLEDGALLLGEPSPTNATATASGTVASASAVQAVTADGVVINGGVIQGVIVGQGGAVAIAVEAVEPAQPAAVEDAPATPPTPATDSATGPDEAKPDAENDEAAPEAEESPKPEPKATIALAEVDSIRFERSAELGGNLVGQPNIDLTGPHPSARSSEEAGESDEEGEEAEDQPKANAPAETPQATPADDLTAPPPGTVRAVAVSVPKADPEASGIRDLQLTLTGLRDVEITQVTVSCQGDEGQTSWRLDSSGSTDWPLVLRRAGVGPRADLFLEPPPSDCFEKPFQVMLTYGDGQSANLSFQADKHSDATLAHDPEGPTPPEFGVRVFLAGGQEMVGALMGLDDEQLRLAVPWHGAEDEPIAIPLDHVLGVLVGLPERNETDESFAARLDDRGAEDLLLARTGEGEVVPIPGIAEGLEDDRIRFLYRNQSRTVPLRLIEGLILADRPIPSGLDDRDGPIASFSLSTGQRISGTWREIDGDSWSIEMPWGATASFPAAEVQSVRFRGGQMTYLSDLEPSKVDETPYFGRPLSWRKDANLRGVPLVIDGRTFERGLAVHSRSELTFELDGRFATFEALVGFDDEARGLGRVDCRVFADDEELFAEPDLRADAPPTPLRLSVEGARTLRLLVDFGADQDTGDRLIWADARLYRDPPPEAQPDAPAEGDGDPKPDNTEG